MALFGKKKEVKEKPKRSYIYIDKNEYAMHQAKKFDEAMKGTIEQDTMKIGKDIGEEHPFDYKIPSGLVREVGFVSAIVQKINNYIWGSGVYTMSDNEKAKDVIDQWMQDVNFENVGREWTFQALIKGFSPMELGGKIEEPPQGIKVLNSDRVFVKRKKTGEVIEFNQIKGGKRINSASKDDVNKFSPFQIADLNLNRMPESAYGLGIVYPMEHTIDNLLASEKDFHQLIRRKAGAPMVAKIGTVEEPPSESDIEGFGQKMTFMNNKTEWAIPADVELDVLNFDIGKNFDSVLEHDMAKMVIESQVPEVIMGRGNIAEGLAKVQMEDFLIYINSLQTEIEKVIEEKIFKRILQANELQAHVELEWGEPSETQQNKRIEQITMLLNNAMLDPNLRTELQKELADLLGVDVEILPAPPNPEGLAADKEQQETEEQLPVVPGSNATEQSFDDYCEGDWVHNGCNH